MLFAKMNPILNKDPLIAIIVSVFITSILVIYPLSYFLSGWRPEYMLLVMLFWILCQPIWCGVWFAFSCGIFLDLLIGAPIGMNALSFVIITFTTRFLTREKRVLNFVHLWVVTSLGVVAHLLLQWLMQIMGGLDFSIARHWQPLLTSIFAFPLVYYCLKRWRV